MEAARAVARSLGVARHVEIDVDLSTFGGSSLTSDLPVPKDGAIDHDEIPSMTCGSPIGTCASPTSSSPPTVASG